MCILHNTISNRCGLDRKNAKTPNKSKDENRRHRIRNRISRRPNPNRRRQNTLHSHRTHERRASYGTPSTTPTRGNMQRRHIETMGRKLVHHCPRLRRSTYGTGKKRLPLRPHRRSTRTNRSGERQHTHENRQAAQIPIRPKKTPNMSRVCG